MERIKNILLNSFGSSTSTNSSTLNLNCNSYVLDDLSVNDNNANVTLGGTYYGYSYSEDNSAGSGVKQLADYSSAILVNGTSVGMAPNVDRTIITDTSMFHKDLFVFDVIYNPEETLFLKKAKAAGCRTLNGLNMLLYQGAASFELWTGKEMPIEHMKEVLNIRYDD